MTRTILFIIAFGCLEPTLAETVYVKDVLFVPLRGGQSTEHKILHRGVRSGTALELLEKNDTTGYSLVRMQSGLEGWVKSQYVSGELIASDRLVAVTEQMSDMRQEVARNQQNVIHLEAEISLLNEASEEMRTSNIELTSELNRITALAADVIKVDQNNLELNEKNKSLSDELDSMILTNKGLEDESEHLWFLEGAGTVLFGLLIGIWVGRRTQSKQPRRLF
jgi:SH3 domain protein|tara:strand:- start:940 stop:1605 length:666 start_codon:yes stop_codon:yes gene_type:complete